MLLLFMDMLDEEQDKLLFQELWDRNKQGMYHLAYSVLQDSGLAEDAVQEAFFKLAERFSFYQKENREQLDHLCTVLVKSKALDIWRKQHHTPFLTFTEEIPESEYGAASENPEEKLLRAEEKQFLYHSLKQALATLSSKESYALLLRHYHGFKSRQIAEILDMKENAVDVLLHRTYRKLRTWLETHDEIR